MGDQKIAYPYLPAGREIILVPLENPFMQAAKKIQEELSNDLLNPTGAVVVKDGIIIGCAANHANLPFKSWQLFHKNTFCVRRFFKIKTGTKYWACPGCAKNKDHAEARAARDAAQKNGDITGADLYLYGHWWCCEPCWNEMIKHGIKNVYILENGVEIFARKK
ncbi:MAG: deaminase [Patescibacteria group bacterium]|jgi:deoxycytidylate deaminase